MYELHDDFVLSTFPLMQLVSWDEQDAQNVLQAITIFGQSLPKLDGRMNLRHLDIEGYARDRLEYASVTSRIDKEVMAWAVKVLDYYERNYALHELAMLDPALVHGDLHENNVVKGSVRPILFIDLDSVAIGPRLYDLASWRVRRELGDAAPIDLAVDIVRTTTTWDEDTFRALMGWKLVSSVSHTIRYGDPAEVHQRICVLNRCGLALGAPGPWGKFGGQG
jgi:hypothetical protein